MKAITLVKDDSGALLPLSDIDREQVDKLPTDTPLRASLSQPQHRSLIANYVLLMDRVNREQGTYETAQDLEAAMKIAAGSRRVIPTLGGDGRLTLSFMIPPDKMETFRAGLRAFVDDLGGEVRAKRDVWIIPDSTSSAAMTAHDLHSLLRKLTVVAEQYFGVGGFDDSASQALEGDKNDG